MRRNVGSPGHVRKFDIVTRIHYNKDILAAVIQLCDIQ